MPSKVTHISSKHASLQVTTWSTVDFGRTRRGRRALKNTPRGSQLFFSFLIIIIFSGLGPLDPRRGNSWYHFRVAGAVVLRMRLGRGVSAEPRWPRATKAGSHAEVAVGQNSPGGANRRFWSMFPLTRVPFWYRLFEPQPSVFQHHVRFAEQDMRFEPEHFSKRSFLGQKQLGNLTAASPSKARPAVYAKGRSGAGAMVKRRGWPSNHGNFEMARIPLGSMSMATTDSEF